MRIFKVAEQKKLNDIHFFDELFKKRKL